MFDAIKIVSDNQDCTVTVTDGKITHLKLNIKNYLEFEQKEPTNVLDIIDKAYTKNTNATLNITDLTTSYVKYGSKYEKVWVVTTDASTEPIVIE